MLVVRRLHCTASHSTLNFLIYYHHNLYAVLVPAKLLTNKRNHCNNLLTSHPTSVNTQLIAPSYSIDIQKQFHEVFSGLKNLGEDYQIKLKEVAVPHTLYTPCNTPIPMREKGHEELPECRSWELFLKSKSLSPGV